jgi:hypothetical protein
LSISQRQRSVRHSTHNLVSREDLTQSGLIETFSYDALNRNCTPPRRITRRGVAKSCE